MTDAVAECLAGVISPQVALARLLLGGADAAAIRAAVQAARTDPATPRWQALAALLEGRDAGLDRLAGEIGQTGSDHTSLGGVASIAAFFDRAVTHSPEAGVALYSLGDPAILHAATAEIVGWLADQGLVHPGDSVLDFGCGFGRVAAALATQGCSVLALDVSAGMVAEAQRRHAGMPGLHFAQTDGHTVPPGPFALVLLADSMPYVVQAGLADTVVAGAAAALQPGGALVVLNLAYGRDPAMDRAEAERWAALHGWALRIDRPFRVWDGVAYVWRKDTLVGHPGTPFGLNVKNSLTFIVTRDSCMNANIVLF